MKKNLNKIKGEKNYNNVVIYKEKGNVRFYVRIEKETVWLSLDQISFLFSRDKSVISRHIKNVFDEKELEVNAVVANFATTASDGKTYNVDYYNLDVIISVGYRVKSQQGVQFRIWATKTLKEYLVQGYTINEKRLLEAKEKFKELQNTIAFLQKKSKKELLFGQEGEILSLLASYAKTLTILDQYDKRSLKEIKGIKGKFVLAYDECIKVIKEVKQELITKEEAGDLFGHERDDSFRGIIRGLYQTFAGKELYATLESKAAHLLYFTIKDHPFSDGNKRTGSFLFVYFLDKHDALYREHGEKKINDNALAALALLVAESDPKEKEQMIALITQLLR